MPYKQQLTVVIITNNSAIYLADCLVSVKWADEIIVLDYNSNDKTKYIAVQAGARVFNSTDWPGFGKQRQRAQEYANGDYILMLDADERVTFQLQQSILKTLKDSNKNINTVYSFARRNFFLGKFIRYGGWYPDKVIRLYARIKYRYNSLLVHESLNFEKADVVFLQGDLEHFTCLDLSSFQKKQLKYAETWALERYNKEKTQRWGVFTIFIYSCIIFIKNWLFRFGFMDGKYGFLLAIIKAQYTFNKYIILWFLNNRL